MAKFIEVKDTRSLKHLLNIDQIKHIKPFNSACMVKFEEKESVVVQMSYDDFKEALDLAIRVSSVIHSTLDESSGPSVTIL